MKVFITGIAGFLGSWLADAFIARGDRVSGIDNLIGGYDDNVPVGADWSICDCNEFERMKKAMRGVDVVFHAAATAHEGLSVFSPHQNAMHGYAASASVFSAACAMGVKRVVFCSSMARYGKGEGPPPFVETMRPMPEDPYGIGKVAAEDLLKNLGETHGVEWVIAVPHSIVGPRQHYGDPFRNVASIFINLMLQRRQPIIYGDGLQERCFSYITDCVDPLVRMATETNVVGETINIGPDDEVVTVLELAKKIATILDFSLDPLFVRDRPREVKIAHCSADKARHLLGYEPKVSLEDGLWHMSRWIQNRGPKPFRYSALDIEIENEKLPETWKKRLF
jgi:UDP-glucose 4-epimerase